MTHDHNEGGCASFIALIIFIVLTVCSIAAMACMFNIIGRL